MDNEETNIETSNNKKNAESVTAGAGGTMQTGGMNEQAADTVRAKNAALEADVGELTQKKDMTTSLSSKSFLVKYVLILLVIAFGLVLMSYLNERRLNKEEIANLKEEKEKYSVSAMKDIQALQDENKELAQQAEELKEKVDDQTKKLDSLQKEKSELTAQKTESQQKADEAVLEENKLTSQLAAIEAMMDINTKYNEGKYSYAAYEIAKLENGTSDYITALFAGQENGPMIEKVLDRYQSVRTWLDKNGYMDPQRLEKWAAKNIQ